MKNRILILVILNILTLNVIAQYSGWTKYSKSNSSIPFEKIFNIEFDQQGNTWFGTNVTGSTGHLCKFDGTYFAPESMSAWIYGIDCDKEGNIWVINSNSELRKWNRTKWTTIENNDISWYSDPFFIDHNGNKWMNPGFTFDLLMYNGINWTTFNSSNSELPEAIINCINEYNNVIYIGTDSGFVTYDGSNWKFFNSSNSGIPDNKICNIQVDKNDSLWFLCGGGYLVSMKNNNWSSYQSEEINGFSYGMDIDTKGNIWLCFSSKVVKFDKTNWMAYTSANSLLPTLPIATLKIDKNDKVWIGTWEGLVTYQDKPSDSTIIIINSQPKTISVNIGETATFKVSASGIQLSFQWTKDGQMITGANDSVFSINSVNYSDAGEYECEISNLWTKVNSTKAILTILPPASLPKDNHLKLTCINPVKDKITLNFNEVVLDGIKVMLFDINGKELFANQYSGKNIEFLNIALNENIYPGIYFLRLMAGEKSATIKLFIE